MYWDVKFTVMAVGCYFPSPQQWLNVLRGFLESLRHSHIQFTVWVDGGACREMSHTPYSTCCTLGGMPRWVRHPMAIYVCPSGFHRIPKVPRSFLLISASLSSIPRKPHTVTGKCTQNTQLSLIWASTLHTRWWWWWWWWGGSWTAAVEVCGKSPLQRLLQQALNENFSIRGWNKSINEESQYTRICVSFKTFKLHLWFIYLLMCAPQHMCEGQRTALRNWFSFSTTWVLSTELRSLGLLASAFSHLPDFALKIV